MEKTEQKKSNGSGFILAAVATGVLGMVGMIVLPFVGLGVGAYYAATAASAAGMGTGACWALGAAGAVGGFVAARIVTAVTTMIGVGALALFGVKKLLKAGDKEDKAAVQTLAKTLKAALAKGAFDDAAAPEKSPAVTAPVQKPSAPAPK